MSSRLNMVELSQFLTNEIRQEIKEAQKEGHFKWLGDAGFFTWFEINKNGKLYIFINNFWIQPEYRGKMPLFWIRKFLKDKYPDVEYGYWERNKNDRKNWHYSKKERI